MRQIRSLGAFHRLDEPGRDIARINAALAELEKEVPQAPGDIRLHLVVGPHEIVQMFAEYEAWQPDRTVLR